MQKLEILTCALEYIEKNIANPIKTEEIAKACFCSKTALENTFRCINNISVHDYITRRRMTKAAKVLSECPDKNILNVALEFGFSSNEAFSRAFRQVWNCNPSDFRKNEKFAELFPKYTGYVNAEKGLVDSMSGRKNVDISELYDLFVMRKDCYFICTDIKHLMGFNEISRKAGDLAILEALRRMNNAVSEEDYVFRIGADEFVILTNTQDEQYAKEIAEKILVHNGESFTYEKQELSLELYVGIVLLENKAIRYKDLFNELHSSIMKTKSQSE